VNNLNKLEQKKIQMGMWHRPFERNLDDVKQTLDELEDLGVNELFVETYFNGQLIYPSKVSLRPMHSFVGDYGPYRTNLLHAFIEEGKLRKINIHAWVENFFVGRYEHIEDSPWFHDHLEWILMNRDQSYLQKNEVNYLFLDPANPEVRVYTLAIYREMMDISGLSSLHLDYIRYPLVYQVTPPDISDDVGYTKIALEAFQTLENIDANLIQHITENDIYQKWCSYKINVINDFVREVHHLIEKSGVPISIAIFGDPNHARIHKMQDWYQWVREGLVDLIIPMAYYRSHQKVYEEVHRLYQLVSQYARVFAGIAPAYMGLDVSEHNQQIVSSINAEADGVVMFATQNYLKQHFMGVSEDHDDVCKMLKEWKRV